MAPLQAQMIGHLIICGFTNADHRVHMMDEESFLTYK